MFRLINSTVYYKNTKIKIRHRDAIILLKGLYNNHHIPIILNAGRGRVVGQHKYKKYYIIRLLLLLSYIWAKFAIDRHAQETPPPVYRTNAHYIHRGALCFMYFIRHCVYWQRYFFFFFKHNMELGRFEKCAGMRACRH